MPLTPEQMAKIKANAARAQQQSSGNDNRLPIVYQPSEGAVDLRIYHDSEGAAMRSIPYHNGPNGGPCIGEHCQICAAVNQLKGWRKVGLYRAQTKTLVYATIFHTSGVSPQDSKYLVLNTPVLFVGKALLGKHLAEHISSLASEAEIENFLSPDVTGVTYALRLKISRQRPWLTMEQRNYPRTRIEPLPPNARPLSHCILWLGYEPNRAKMDRFINEMRRAYDVDLNIKEVAAPEPAVVQPAPVTVDPSDFYDGAPHELCPSFARYSSGSSVCMRCDVVDQCMRMSAI